MEYSGTLQYVMQNFFVSFSNVFSWYYFPKQKNVIGVGAKRA